MAKGILNETMFYFKVSFGTFFGLYFILLLSIDPFNRPGLIPNLIGLDLTGDHSWYLRQFRMVGISNS